jgi:hypothetical protein
MKPSEEIRALTRLMVVAKEQVYTFKVSNDYFMEDAVEDLLVVKKTLNKLDSIKEVFNKYDKEPREPLNYTRSHQLNAMMLAEIKEILKEEKT